VIDAGVVDNGQFFNQLDKAESRLRSRAVIMQNMHKLIAELDAEIESLRATISRLREYARHDTRCERHRWQGDLRRKCDCGYDELIKEIGNDA